MTRATILFVVLPFACADEGTSPRYPTPGDAAGGDAASGGDAFAGDPTPGDPGVDPWAGCPTSADYVGDTWTFTLQVAEDAHYCNQGDESQTLDSEFLRKTMIRIAPGSFAIPDATISTAVPFTLPVCIAFVDGEAPVLDGVGEVTANFSAAAEGEWFSISARQPLSAGSQAYDLRLDFIGLREAGQTVVVADGAMKSDDFGFGLVSGWLCRGTECWVDADEYRFISACDYSALPLQQHHIEFNDGTTAGEIDLDIHFGSSPASTEPAMYVLAAGNIGGVGFSQDDFWQLFYRPTHHHFTRDFGVIFDEPIGGACGIKIYDVNPWDTGDPSLHTTDCSLESLPATWTVTESTTTLP